MTSHHDVPTWVPTYIDLLWDFLRDFYGTSWDIWLTGDLFVGVHHGTFYGTSIGKTSPHSHQMGEKPWHHDQPTWRDTLQTQPPWITVPLKESNSCFGVEERTSNLRGWYTGIHIWVCLKMGRYTPILGYPNFRPVLRLSFLLHLVQVDLNMSFSGLVIRHV